VTLTKVATTLRERMTARTMSPTIEVPHDDVDAAWLYRVRPACARSDAARGRPP
jgi:hypothetical protein